MNMDSIDVPPYVQLFEFDEILVVVLRYLRDDKRCISELFATSKLIQSRLCSTALWKSLGYVFYNHNDKTITPKMLWHLLRERQIELNREDFSTLHLQPENAAEKLKYLLALVEKSEKEASLMVRYNWLKTPLLDVMQWNDTFGVQELTCNLLFHLFLQDLQKNHLGQAHAHAPFLVRLVLNNVEKEDKISLTLAACRALSKYGDMRLEDRLYPPLVPMIPVLIQLMQHENAAFRIAAFRIAGIIASGDGHITQGLTSAPKFWPVITEALSDEQVPIRADAAWILSNIAAEGPGPNLNIVASEAIFQKLLSLRFDEEEVSDKALWVFGNLLQDYDALNNAQKLLWQKYFDEVIEYAEMRLKEYIRRLEKGLAKTSTILWTLKDLVDAILKFPNKEIWLQKLTQRELVTLLSSPLLDSDPKLPGENRAMLDLIMYPLGIEIDEPMPLEENEF